MDRSASELTLTARTTRRAGTAARIPERGSSARSGPDLAARVALQVITIPDQDYDRYLRGTDWIRKYIFPGGHLLSLSAMQDAIARRSSFIRDRVENIGPQYATTLRAWRRRFWRHIEEVRALGFDERFVRMWNFYPATCEVGFANRKPGDLQLALARSGGGYRQA